MYNLAIFASHNGSVIEVIYKAISDDKLNAKLSLIITNNTNAPVLEKAKRLGIPAFVINDKTCENVEDEIIKQLETYTCKNIFLAGYMKKISSTLANNYNIINSHPALLPKFGGKGMYGRFVHKAVIENKECISGVTIHHVNENYDEGGIILQKSIPVLKEDTPESLESKIKILEQEAVIEALDTCLK
jgi:phosphoribosylglycinamide formyltransferase-1